MLDSPLILGDSDGVDWTKLIPFGVLLVIWAVGAMVAAARKAAGGQSPPASVAPPLRPPFPPPVTRAPPVYGASPYAPYGAPPPMPPVYSAPAVIPLAQRVAPPPVPGRRRKGAAPPTLPSSPAPGEPTGLGSTIFTSELAPSPAAPRTAETSARPRLTPASLRSAIVLGEVFDPPPALRQEPRPEA